jgi:hypothetical protein
VRQVRFNAWHYSDDQLWTGLMSHLFQVLAAPDNGEPDVSPAGQRSVIATRTRLRSKLAQKEQASRRLGAELKAAEAVPRPSGPLAWLLTPVYDTRAWGAAADPAGR